MQALNMWQGCQAILTSLISVFLLVLVNNRLSTQWLGGDFVLYAKRCRGGTEVSAKITCDKKGKGLFGKGA